ncbi:MipA/OmpV family protein [Psychrosphaera sp. B3R10]|uniref:MipA/OmpV family protein n=1 Tax=unclassified Psychrosphaera TaxID=2641570 RepID=UPI001C0874F5|nr:MULTISPECIES: MipA/OmpV family protein [unclassified Psychrosphaera]MBU2881861.1 MipA/OmpV family protein [Psychrosphaera sp. I2R16]MBU2989882.1 MipA/OmpV family protein [Psychrosphaera sp. B3R10]MDO6720942.1 MipA/OmpV family protein [Psychrosphaera sp. 1_MG-2023]
MIKKHKLGKRGYERRTLSSITATLLLSGMSFTSSADSLSIGVGAAGFEMPYQETSTQQMFFPTVNYAKGNFQVGIFGASYNIKQEASYAVSVGISPGEFFLDASKSNDVYIQQLDDRSFSLYVNSKVSFYGTWGAFSASLEQDISGQSSGQRVVAQYAYPMTVSPELTITPLIETSWLSQKVNDFYFGIDQSESSTFEPYEASSGVNIGLGVSALYSFNAQWQFMLAARYAKLDDTVASSPIVDNTSSTSAFMVVNYKFW